MQTLNAIIRHAIASRAAVSSAEPVHVAIAACRAVARREIGASRLSSAIAREVDSIVLASRGIVGAVPVAAPVVMRLSDEDRAAIVRAVQWLGAWLMMLLRVLAAKRAPVVIDAGQPWIPTDASRFPSFGTPMVTYTDPRALQHVRGVLVSTGAQSRSKR